MSKRWNRNTLAMTRRRLVYQHGDHTAQPTRLSLLAYPPRFRISLPMLPELRLLSCTTSPISHHGTSEAGTSTVYTSSASTVRYQTQSMIPKELLIEDVGSVARTLDSGWATGILVTGDIAFGGREREYRAAANWLDRVANAAGCPKHRIQLVPGNHDIDRAQSRRSPDWYSGGS